MKNNQINVPSLYFFKENYLDFENAHHQMLIDINNAFRKLNIPGLVEFIGASLSFMKFKVVAIENEDFPILNYYFEGEVEEELAKILRVPTIRYYDFSILEVPYRKELRTIPNFSKVDFAKLKNSTVTLPVLSGMISETNYIVSDLAKFPHLLIGGATRSGKSNWIHSMILSLLLNFKPDELKLMLIDNKGVEFSPYNDIPHLLSPVITTNDNTIDALSWCVNEMERRYILLVKKSVRDITGYNEKVDNKDRLPYIVVVIDEFADVMLSKYRQKIEESIVRLAQKSRAVGIHLVIATQNTSTDIITPLIIANIPSRIAFSMSSEVDSKAVLGYSGAEALIDRGDFLLTDLRTGEPTHLQAPFVKDEDIEQITKYWRKQGEPNYIEIPKYQESVNSDDELDPLFDEVVQYIRETKSCSVSKIQRRFKIIGFSRAARILAQLEQKQIVSPPLNGKRYLL
ncbi:hypothetical protein BKK52_11955 [Rodentibacter trehalosifermentans]|uniref:DNA translocase FtsK n=1 Tax=Rodentibacter trehalosifermentans TaxID=1908263 RepID=A0A1V3IU95_9PAST|nr:FtsK/SpoIIIE domain-containing protein [Rodentibacter trehalosifermentans]OOF45820.1 hypothetical protein BKK52_11955 [Rodentibacter trehalosifermentans]